jgi:prophage regulatory protein
MKQQTSKTQIIQFDELPDSAFIRLNQLLATAVIPFSAATCWRRVRAGTFPHPVKISSQVTAWQVGQIRAWLKNPASYVAESNSPDLEIDKQPGL